MIEADEIEVGQSLSMPFLRSQNLYEVIDKETLSDLVTYITSLEFASIQKRAVMKLRAANTLPNPDKHKIPDTDIELTFEGYGVYSLVFSILVGTNKISIRVRNEYDSNSNPNKTNYMYEFIRFSQLREDQEVTEILSQYGITFPEAYLGTTEFELREFVEGRILPESEAQRIVPLISPVLNDFLERMRREDPKRWESVSLDIIDQIGRGSGKNFIVSSVDNRIYLIDPFTG